MKKYFLLIFIAFFTACFNADDVNIINTQEFKTRIQNDNYIIIDTRIDSYYNGFKEKGAKNGGHIKNAIAISALSTEFIEDSKFQSYMQSKGISKEKTLVLYGSNLDEIKKINAEFSARGYKCEIYKDFIEYANNNELEQLKNYQVLVSPDWLYDLMQSQKDKERTFDIFEVSWGEQSKEYDEHIPTAYHFNTDLIENGPIWNLSSDEVLKENLLSLGIDADKTIILYSQNQMAALRVFWALKYMGVKDVRYLNGGLYAWQQAGYKTQTKVNIPSSKKNTAYADSFKINKNINISMPKDLKKYEKNNLKLISIRAWDEYIGKISGYDYIKTAGEIPNAIWGFAGTNSSNVADYFDPDGTLRNPYEIYKLWQSQGINKNDYLAFYCGTGWRASVAWFFAFLDGWENIYVYDGGWNAWQMDKSLKIQKNDNLKKPDSKNDYGKVFKEGASCKS